MPLPDDHVHMERTAARVLAVALACATLAALGGCLYGPTWTPDSPREVNEYADDFTGTTYYP